MDEEFEPRLPCLFDRLIDEAPDSELDTAHRRTASLDDYRNAVLRDLRWLMNAPRHLLDEDMYLYEAVSTSVLNFGTRDLSGMTTSCIESDRIMEEGIEEAIKLFEPRINPDSVEVSLVTDYVNMEVGKMAFEITGELWALPHAERIAFRTEMDLETGQCEVKSIR